MISTTPNFECHLSGSATPIIRTRWTEWNCSDKKGCIVSYFYFRYERIRKPLNQLMEGVYKTIQINKPTHRDDITMVLLQSLEVCRSLFLYQTKHLTLAYWIELSTYLHFDYKARWIEMVEYEMCATRVAQASERARYVFVMVKSESCSYRTYSIFILQWLYLISNYLLYHNLSLIKCNYDM